MNLQQPSGWPRWLWQLLPSVFGLIFMPLAQAEVSHVSINQRLFDLAKPPLIKVNIVAGPQDPDRLQFILRQKSGEEKLMVQQINNYMLLLMGVEEVNDPNALLLVQQYQGEQWLEIGQLPVFSKSVPVGNPPDPSRFSLYRNPTVKKVPESAVVATKPAITPATKAAPAVPAAVARDGQCTLEYHGTETLWRLATQYAKQWHTNVYAAALAIMAANPKAFVKGKPGNLRSDVRLHCPAAPQWELYADKTLAKEKFEALM